MAAPGLEESKAEGRCMWVWAGRGRLLAGKSEAQRAHSFSTQSSLQTPNWVLLGGPEPSGDTGLITTFFPSGALKSSCCLETKDQTSGLTFRLPQASPTCRSLPSPSQAAGDMRVCTALSPPQTISWADSSA